MNYNYLFFIPGYTFLLHVPVIVFYRPYVIFCCLFICFYLFHDAVSISGYKSAMTVGA